MLSLRQLRNCDALAREHHSGRTSNHCNVTEFGETPLSAIVQLAANIYGTTLLPRMADLEVLGRLVREVKASKQTDGANMRSLGARS